MSATTEFRVGVRLEFDGQRWELAELAGRDVVLRDGEGERLRRVALAWLLSHPGLRLLGAGDAAQAVVPVAVLLAESEMSSAEFAARIGDVQEALTGFRHGSVELALPGEPASADRDTSRYRRCRPRWRHALVTRVGGYRFRR